MKVGDLVRWKADNGIGTILRVVRILDTDGAHLDILDIHWQTGLGTGRISSDHIQLEWLSDHKKDSSC